MSRKQLVSTYGVLAAVFATAIAAHDVVVIPLIRQAVAEDRDNAIKVHGERTHKNAVHKDEFSRLAKTLERHEVAAKADRIRLEGKVDRLIEMGRHR
jgi:hypothetical protein